ncbi:MAG TPA: hypothetical protein VIF88_04725 [Methylocystis sp.]
MSTTSQSNVNLQAEATAAFTSALADADITTIQGLQTLSSVHQARVARLNRAAARAVAQFGPKSAEATQAQAAAATAGATAAHVEILQQQGGTPQPDVAKTGWALHGRIYHANLKPAASYCVFLVDSTHAYQNAFGFAYTDSTGYFLLSFGAAATEASAPPKLFVEIADPNGQPVYLSATAFEPTPGVASYNTYTLPADEKPIGDPPRDIRDIALQKPVASAQAQKSSQPPLRESKPPPA